MADDGNDDKSYDVGRGKPPRHTRFKPGQSGNPAGRPRKDRNPKIYNVDHLRREILQMSNRTVNVVIDGEQLPLPMIMAVYMKLYKKAMEGNIWAIREIIKLVSVLYKEEGEQQIAFMEILATIEEAREEKMNEMTRYELEMERYKHFKARRGWRKMMKHKAHTKPYEAEEPVDERDWQAYEQYLDDLKNNRKGTWPPAYWDEEEKDPGPGGGDPGASPDRNPAPGKPSS